MTIRQILRKRDKLPNCAEINYTNEKGVCWHARFKDPFWLQYHFPFADCPVQSFKDGKIYEIFSVRSKDLPEYIVAVNDYTPPARKSDLDSGKMTVRDYLATQKNVKKVHFVRAQPNFQYKDVDTNHVVHCEDLYWYTDYFDVQELSGSLSFMADLFVDTVKISDSDETSLQIFTTEYEDWERQKLQKVQHKEANKKINDAFFVFCCIGSIVCPIVGACLGRHVSGGFGTMGTAIGIVCGFLGGVASLAVIESILKASGKFPYN